MGEGGWEGGGRKTELNQNLKHLCFQGYRQENENTAHRIAANILKLNIHKSHISKPCLLYPYLAYMKKYYKSIIKRQITQLKTGHKS